MISMIIRLIEDDYEGWKRTYIHHQDEKGLVMSYNPMNKTEWHHETLGIRVLLDGFHTWVNSRRVGPIAGIRLRRAIRRATGQRIMNYLTNRTHPDLPALTAPRA